MSPSCSPPPPAASRLGRLTPAGSLLVDHAEVILGGIAAAEADLEALRGGGHTTVRVAVFTSAARVLWARRISSASACRIRA